MRPSPQVIAMKLPMLFKSLFESEPTPVAPSPIVEHEPEEAPRIEPEKAPLSACLEQRESGVTPIAPRSHDPLLDCIDTLGEVVLSLDAQLREERTSNTALRSSLNRELAALRNVLQ